MSFEQVVKCPNCSGKGKVKVISSDALRERRINAGVSLRAVAKKLNFSPPYISDIELGKRRCPKRVLEFYENL